VRRLDRLLVIGSPLVGVCTPISFPPTSLSPPDLMSAFDWRAPIPSPCAYTCCCTSNRALLFRRFGRLFLHWLPILCTIHDRSYAKAPSHAASNLATNFFSVKLDGGSLSVTPVNVKTSQAKLSR
ncbi:hypothetical protein CCUS01_14757, partial [Colletotrichum cuscutae]